MICHGFCERLPGADIAGVIAGGKLRDPQAAIPWRAAMSMLRSSASRIELPQYQWIQSLTDGRPKVSRSDRCETASSSAMPTPSSEMCSMI
jgi:hypothetical protein